MHVSKKTLIVLGLIIGAPFAYIQYYYPTISWNQKLTLVVQTPDGEKTASTVTKVTVEYIIRILPETGRYRRSIYGEALAIELSDGKYLFSLIDDSFASLALKTFKDELPEGLSDEASNVRNIRWLRGSSSPVPFDSIPPMVTFADINDPISVVQLPPKNIASILGDGFVLKSAMLEITREEITSGKIATILPPSFFKQRAQASKEANERGGFTDPYFDTYSSELYTTNFIRQE